MKKLIITGLILLFAAGLYSAQTTVNTSSDTFKTAWDRQQAMNTELYGKWTSLGATHDTGAELDALYEGELTNEAGLYAALSDVSDFVQPAEVDANVGAGAAIGDTAFTDLTAGDTYSNFGDAADDTIDELFDAIDTAIGGLGGGHDAVTLNANATAAGLSLSTQEINY